jgi:pyruvate dehydrogenase E2 component (dihydrolipoamide acetyltransferase)
MALEVAMPQMGYDMTEGTVVRWLKREGDEVQRNEVIAEIETDKATVEMEAAGAGILRRIVVPEGQLVPVGWVIAYIGDADEAIPDAGAAPAQAPSTEPPATAAPANDQDVKISPMARHAADERGIDPRLVTGTGPGRRITQDDVRRFAEAAAAAGAEPITGDRLAISPMARRLARERGIAPADIAGTGPGGRITRDDVLGHGSGTQPAPAKATASAGRGLRAGFDPRTPNADGVIPLGKMAQAIARRTQATNSEAPLFYVTIQVDMTKAAEFRHDLNQALGAGKRVSINDIILKACAMALQRHPVFNSTFEDDRLVVHPHVNMGMAVALPEGLVVPAVMGCEAKSLAEISRDSRDVAKRARSGTLRQEEYTGTFSVSNLGMYDVDAFTAIIVSPQVAVLATGAVQAKPVVVSGEVMVRQMMSATLSTDHRAANGAEAAQFAMEIKRLLENPSLLMMQ